LLRVGDLGEFILPKGTLPLYARLAADIRTQITDGRLKPGDRLPTEAQLIDLHGVSRITVREALQVLIQSGQIERFAGRGTFITQSANVPSWTIDSIDDVFRLPTLETTIVDWRAVSAPPEVASFLQTGNERVYRLRGVRKRGVTPLHYIEIYVPSSIGERLNERDFLAQTVIEAIEGTLKLPVTTTIEEISAAAATSFVARRVRVAVGAPLLVQDIRFIGPSQRPLEWARVWWRAAECKRRNVRARAR
jgi:GntR family transcriptional regulator